MPLNVNKVCKFIAFNLLTHRDDKGLTWGNRKKRRENLWNEGTNLILNLPWFYTCVNFLTFIFLSKKSLYALHREVVGVSKQSGL